jgi:hypothetical protein
MNHLDEHLTGAFEQLAEDAPHRPDLADRVRHQARRQRLITRAGLAAGTVAVAVAGLLVWPHDAKAPDVAIGTPATCRSVINREALPEWANAGFSDPGASVPFVRSTSGNVVAILLGDELAAPPRKDVSNKVLWVWRTLPTDLTSLHATARLNGTGPAVTAGLPTPAGPSGVDLPSPGCWRLTLTWPGGSDTIDLRALPPEAVERS